MSAHDTDTNRDHDEKGKEPKTIMLTIRTPAGIGHDFTVRDHDRVEKTIRKAVDHFVARNQLVAGNYGLAVIRNGVAVEMPDAARLEDFDVVAHDVLCLINKDPQVDG